jgi:hypothetical protein
LLKNKIKKSPKGRRAGPKGLLGPKAPDPPRVRPPPQILLVVCLVVVVAAAADCDGEESQKKNHAFIARERED